MKSKLCSAEENRTDASSETCLCAMFLSLLIIMGVRLTWVEREDSLVWVETENSLVMS